MSTFPYPDCIGTLPSLIWLVPPTPFLLLISDAGSCHAVCQVLYACTCGFRGVVGEQASALVQIDVLVDGVRLPVGKLPNGVSYVESVVGKPYTLSIQNLSNRDLCVRMNVDGEPVAPHRHLIHPFESRTYDSFVTSQEYDHHGVLTEIKHRLQFAEVPLVPRGSAAGELGATVVQKEDEIAALGTFSVQVYDVVSVYSPRHVHRAWSPPAAYHAEKSPVALLEGASKKVHFPPLHRGGVFSSRVCLTWCWWWCWWWLWCWCCCCWCWWWWLWLWLWWLWCVVRGGGRGGGRGRGPRSTF